MAYIKEDSWQRHGEFNRTVLKAERARSGMEQDIRQLQRLRNRKKHLTPGNIWLGSSSDHLVDSTIFRLGKWDNGYLSHYSKKSKMPESGIFPLAREDTIANF